MKKKLFLCCLLFVNSCDAQPKEDHVAQTKTECQFSFESITECFYKTSEFDVTANIESENIANDEKSLKKIIAKVNGTQQTLIISQDTSILTGDIGYISFTDINFDKIPDLALTTSFGTSNLYLDYWIFDPEQKKYISVGNYPKFDINEQKKTLSSKVKNNAETYQNMEWRWNNSTLEKR